MVRLAQRSCVWWCNWNGGAGSAGGGSRDGGIGVGGGMLVGWW